MTINYNSYAYCAYVKNGKVEYCREYADNSGRIVYTEIITEKEFNKRLN